MSGVACIAPFPYFGGKANVAAEVWRRFGDVPNYVEPFFGSGAVLLARPHASRVETINDSDHFISNFWRAVQADPDVVAQWADRPVSECDLQGIHYWLITEGVDRIARIAGDPFHYDAQVAGFWVWGVCAWIGSGWCSGKGPWSWDGNEWIDRRQLPRLGDAGCGVNRASTGIANVMRSLTQRLRKVRVACGDWSRVCGDSVIWRHVLTGVFLDPPYSEAERHMGVYRTDCGSVAADARDWAIANGDNKLLRIALCGYAGEHDMPRGWTAHAWKAHGGYGNQGNGRGRDNAAREVVWFSPHCLASQQPDLFAVAAE